MTLYDRIEKVLKYRVNRILSKGLLKRQNFERFTYLLIIGFFIVFISGLPGLTDRNASLTILFFVINIIYGTSMFIVLRNIEYKSRDYFLIFVGMSIVIITLLFNIWIGFIR